MNDRRWPSHSLGWFFLFALLFHLGLTKIPLLPPDPPRPNVAESEKPVELTPYDAKTDLDLPVVRTEKAEEPAEDDGKPARFAGEFRNRVKEETQAQRKGKFQESTRIPTVPFSAGPGEGGSPGPSFSDLLAFPQSPNALPGDITKGGRTLLNTEPVMYAGFINRVADEIYDAWVSHAGSAIERIYAGGKRLESTVYVTKITVVLNRDGGVASLKVLKSSGIRELDEAPKKAFWDAEPFPNPPSQMFDDDGLVRFVYEFHYEWRSAGFNIVPLI